MIEIIAIDHVVLRTNQLTEMMHFYCDILGCVEERRLDDLGLVQLRAGAGLIDLVDIDSVLGRQGGAAPGTEGHNLDHVCLRIASIDEQVLRNYLAQHGINSKEFAERYGATGFGRSIYIEDPQGNVVELKLER